MSCSVLRNRDLEGTWGHWRHGNVDSQGLMGGPGAGGGGISTCVSQAPSVVFSHTHMQQCVREICLCQNKQTGLFPLDEEKKKFSKLKKKKIPEKYRIIITFRHSIVDTQ